MPGRSFERVETVIPEKRVEEVTPEHVKVSFRCGECGEEFDTENEIKHHHAWKHTYTDHRYVCGDDLYYFADEESFAFFRDGVPLETRGQWMTEDHRVDWKGPGWYLISTWTVEDGHGLHRSTFERSCLSTVQSLRDILRGELDDLRSHIEQLTDTLGLSG
jgi:hypothetical protein